jgi:hypothetical protein
MRMNLISINDTTWRRHSLVREVSVILLIKVMLLLLLWWVFFHVPADKRIDTREVSSHVFGTAAPQFQIPEEVTK